MSGRLAILAAAALALAGCDGGGAASKPQPDPPEVVFKKMLAVYESADGKAQWAMLSKRQQEQSLKALEGLKAAPEQLKEVSGQLGSTPEAVKGMGPEEFATLVMKAQLKDAAAMKRLRDLQAPRVARDGARLRVSALSSDGKFEKVLYMVEEERGVLKVDDDEEFEHEVQKVGD